MNLNTRMATVWNSKSNLAWFKPCPGCAGERPATVWCEPCNAGFCVEDFDARHSAGAYRTHKAAKICRELKLNCHDCGDTKALPSLIFCHTCNRFLCDLCDRYCHNDGHCMPKMDHHRQRYEVDAGGWVFYCPGCSLEQRAAQDPGQWCNECGKAYCQEHCKSRHETGEFRKHIPQIQTISAQLELPCDDCKDMLAADSLDYCHTCNGMFCKVCSRFRHNNLPVFGAHSISSYHKTGVVRTVSDPQGFFSKVNSFCKVNSDSIDLDGKGVRRLWPGGRPVKELVTSDSEQDILHLYELDTPPEEDILPPTKPPLESVEPQVFLEVQIFPELQISLDKLRKSLQFKTDHEQETARGEAVQVASSVTYKKGSEAGESQEEAGVTTDRMSVEDVLAEEKTPPQEDCKPPAKPLLQSMTELQMFLDKLRSVFSEYLKFPTEEEGSEAAEGQEEADESGAVDAVPVAEGAGRPSSRTGSDVDMASEERDERLHTMERVAMSFVQIMKQGIKISLFLPGKSKPKPMMLILKGSMLVCQRDPAGKQDKSFLGGSFLKKGKLDQVAVHGLAEVAKEEAATPGEAPRVALRFVDGRSLVFTPVGNGHSGGSNEDDDGDEEKTNLVEQANIIVDAIVQGFTLILTAKEADELDLILGQDTQEEGSTAGVLPAPVN